jgi:hypothetical protein
MRFDFLACAVGGGRNMAYLLGLYERGIRPDLMTFADTKGEKPGTYSAIERMSNWCQDHFGLPITVLTKNSMYDSLEDQSLRTKTLPSAAYGWRSCSDKWKIQPQDKHMNNLPTAQALWRNGKKITKALGYDAGETRRGESLKENDKYRFWFPLKEWGWYLEDCKAAFVRHGLPIPPKSACFYCPSSTKVEVIQLSQEHPDLFARAVAIERTAREAGTLQTVKGLGRHWTWEELVKNAATPDQLSMFPESVQMNCTCFDSEED